MSGARVLVAGAHIGLVEQMEACVERAFREAGCELRMFDYRASRVAPSFLKRLIPAGLRAKLSPRRVPAVERADAARSNAAFLEEARRLRPELFVALRADRLAPESVLRLKESGAFAVNWLADDPERFVPPETVAPYDVWAVVDATWAGWLKRHGAKRVEHLPLACDPALHHPVELAPEECRRWQSKICFVGSYSPSREAALSAVADLGLSVWGPGWSAAADPAVRARVREERALPREEWLKAYAAADVVVNVHAQAVEGLNMRVWESLAAGACLVGDARADIERFLPGAVATFRDAGELRAVCSALLEDPARRRAQAEAGRKRVIENHTFLHRARVLLEWGSAAR
ncbi:MAG: glycosyltransferase [Elusimicrobia bacterium]|nr:glycosyltransferase [Elusimicrobiota bacterium]